ncbi:hypothetical protein AM1_C0070 (plasmid) [Acaryochloris marina MBIC11017]|uniref:Uncharacterized protein n=1 Tax=Acaryochloris marina (strain MBIC 11017) TaxID=329726 RepID=A8ZMG9_ACAM1|nr:hypothetical protein AM1_C0070 [Acaryochloris marina MBIC11017]
MQWKAHTQQPRLLMSLAFINTPPLMDGSRPQRQQVMVFCLFIGA